MIKVVHHFTKVQFIFFCFNPEAKMPINNRWQINFFSVSSLRKYMLNCYTVKNKTLINMIYLFCSLSSLESCMCALCDDKFKGCWYNSRSLCLSNSRHTLGPLPRMKKKKSFGFDLKKLTLMVSDRKSGRHSPLQQPCARH